MAQYTQGWSFSHLHQVGQGKTGENAQCREHAENDGFAAWRRQGLSDHVTHQPGQAVLGNEPHQAAGDSPRERQQQQL